MGAQPFQSRVIKTELIDWRKLQFIQQENFKEIDDSAKERLANSLESNHFTQPFYVWEDPRDSVIYCLDGKHRTIVLEWMAENGKKIPQKLPATFIKCKNKQEAAKLVLIYSSIYAKISQQGLHDFLDIFELDYEDLREELDLPEFSFERFEQKFDLFEVNGEEEEEIIIEDEEAYVKAGDIFQINGHRIACGSFDNEELIKELMGGKKARIVNCDPPYNIPMRTITNTERRDFAMGVGEMNDEQFVEFLSTVMQRSVENTVSGSIHYIFMDWRHVWHITEAAKKNYDSYMPKQMCVWTKDNMGNGSFYRPKHELCFIFKSGADSKHLSHMEMKDRIRTNVWTYPSSTSIKNPDRFELKNHPTPKPVAMISDAILDTTNPKDIVIDWFLGSGTCLIASEKTNRLCYATEIDPLYVQLSIQRYVKHCEKNNIEINFEHLNGELTLQSFSHESAIQ